MSSVTNFFNSGVWYFSGDVVLLVTLFVIFLAYAIYFGKNRIISLILAFYPAQFLYEHFPFLNSLLFMKGEALITLNKCLIFLVFLILLDILIGRYVFRDSGFGSAHYVRMAGYAVTVVILILIFSYSVVNLSVFHDFSPSIDALFASPDRIFFWNLAPLALLFVL